MKNVVILGAVAALILTAGLAYLPSAAEAG
jgi:hypothetical protein